MERASAPFCCYGIHGPFTLPAVSNATTQLLTGRCCGTQSSETLLDYFTARSVNAPLGISSAFYRCNLGISTPVMMFEMPSSEFYVVLVDGDMQPKIFRISKKEICQPQFAVNNEHYHRKTVAIGYHREPLLRILCISQSNQSSNQFY